MTRLVATLILLYIGVHSPLAAQEGELETTLALDADDASVSSLLVESCAYLLANPIDLNAATPSDLAQLPFLTEVDIRAILLFRYKYTRFNSRYELLLVPGLSQQFARMALPYVTVTAEALPTPVARRAHHRVLVESNRCVNQRAGYSNVSPEAVAADSAYRGNAWHHKVRYLYNSGSTVRAALTVEKDPGEPYRQGAPWVGDSYNYFWSYRSDRSALRQLIVGDYRAAMGCGLMLNQQFSMGKNMLSTQLLGRTASVMPLTSAEEADYLHGVAARWQWGGVEFAPFVSLRRLDGTATDSCVTALATTGYHRTRSEEAQRHTLQATVVGVHAAWSNHRLRLGGNVLHTRFGMPYIRPERYYNLQAFRGSRLTQASAEWALQIARFSAKGEVACSDNGALASMVLLRYQAAERWQWLLIGRDFGRSYQQLYASTFSESSDVQAERGLYVQAYCEAAAHLNLTASMDLFRFTAPKYGIVAASSGCDVQLRADVNHLLWSATLRYRLKQKEATNTATTHAVTLQHYFRHTADLILSFQPSDRWLLKQQWQYRLYSRQFVGSSNGLGVSQRISYKTGAVALHLLGEWFHTDDYNARVYLPDLNLRYSYSSTMLYGLGVRYGVACSWRITPHLLVEGKYTLVNYGDRNTISSKLQQIEGNNQHDVSLQCLWKL